MVEAAHELGRKITASAFGTGPINAALRAGVDGIVHGVFLDEESIRLFLLTGAFFIPTLNAAETVREMALDSAIPVSDTWRQENLEIHRAMTAGFTRAHKAGVRIAFGTDAGWRQHGDNAEQFLHLVAGGMNETEAIIAATVNAAAAMGWSERVGTLEPGKYADFIAVPASPVQDITQLQQVVCVVKGGVVYDCPAADPPSSAARNGWR
jgi:imidazolonepropionase-like amidohydrolase